MEYDRLVDITERRYSSQPNIHGETGQTSHVQGGAPRYVQGGATRYVQGGDRACVQGDQGNTQHLAPPESPVWSSACLERRVNLGSTGSPLGNIEAIQRAASELNLHNLEQITSRARSELDLSRQARETSRQSLDNVPYYVNAQQLPGNGAQRYGQAVPSTSRGGHQFGQQQGYGQQYGGYVAGQHRRQMSQPVNQPTQGYGQFMDRSVSVQDPTGHFVDRTISIQDQTGHFVERTISVQHPDGNWMDSSVSLQDPTTFPIGQTIRPTTPNAMEHLAEEFREIKIVDSSHSPVLRHRVTPRSNQGQPQMFSRDHHSRWSGSNVQRRTDPFSVQVPPGQSAFRYYDHLRLSDNGLGTGQFGRDDSLRRSDNVLGTRDEWHLQVPTQERAPRHSSNELNGSERVRHHSGSKPRSFDRGQPFRHSCNELDEDQRWHVRVPIPGTPRRRVMKSVSDLRTWQEHDEYTKPRHGVYYIGSEYQTLQSYADASTMSRPDGNPRGGNPGNNDVSIELNNRFSDDGIDEFAVANPTYDLMTGTIVPNCPSTPFAEAIKNFAFADGVPFEETFTEPRGVERAPMPWEDTIKRTHTDDLHTPVPVAESNGHSNEADGAEQIESTDSLDGPKSSGSLSRFNKSLDFEDAAKDSGFMSQELSSRLGGETKLKQLFETILNYLKRTPFPNIQGLYSTTSAIHFMCLKNCKHNLEKQMISHLRDTKFTSNDFKKHAKFHETGPFTEILNAGRTLDNIKPGGCLIALPLKTYEGLNLDMTHKMTEFMEKVGMAKAYTSTITCLATDDQSDMYLITCAHHLSDMTGTRSEDEYVYYAVLPAKDKMSDPEVVYVGDNSVALHGKYMLDDTEMFCDICAVKMCDKTTPKSIVSSLKEHYGSLIDVTAHIHGYRSGHIAMEIISETYYQNRSDGPLGPFVFGKQKSKHLSRSGDSGGLLTDDRELGHSTKAYALHRSRLNLKKSNLSLAVVLHNQMKLLHIHGLHKKLNILSSGS